MKLSEAPPARRRPLFAGTALLAASALLFAPQAAFAAEAPYAPPAAITAIESGLLEPGFEAEFAAQFDQDAAYEHVRQLAVEIGPRATGTVGEQAAADYVQSVLEEYGYDITFENFPVTAPRYGIATSDRELPGGPIWQFRAATNGAITGADAPITASVIDVGAGDLTGVDVTGAIVLANYPANAAARNALIVEIAAAGAAGIILTPTTPNGATQNVGTLTTAQSIPVVSGGTVHGERIRTLLAEAPLTLTLHTAYDQLPGLNIIGTRPAIGEDAANAPIVYVTSHIDSVVGSPGANDDASGVGVMLEIARIASLYPLDTEIRIAGWGGEESGLLGSRFHANSLTAADIERIIGVWQMDMVGTPHTTEDRPWTFWGHSYNGVTNAVLEQAAGTSEALGFGPLDIGRMTGSDHQPFGERGIPAAVFSWMYWAPPSTFGLEPDYHRPSDTMANVSAEKLGVAGQIVGASALSAAANEVKVTVLDEHGAPAAGIQVAMQCAGDESWRDAGVTDETGIVTTLAPSLNCSVAAVAENGASGLVADVAVSGDTEVTLNLVVDTTAPTITLTVDPPAAASGWHISSPVTVTVEASDDRDVAPAAAARSAAGGTQLTVEYRIGDGEWQPYVGPFEIADEGEHTIEVRASDTAGNTTTESLVVKIDTVAPEVTAVVDPSDSTTILVDASDATSGVERIEMRFDDGEWTVLEGTLSIPADAKTVTFRAVDVAGNVGAEVTVDLANDSTGGGTVIGTDPVGSAAPSVPVPPASPATSGDLARTGADGSPILGLIAAMAAIVAGAALYAHRRGSAE